MQPEQPDELPGAGPDLRERPTHRQPALPDAAPDEHAIYNAYRAADADLDAAAQRYAYAAINAYNAYRDAHRNELADAYRAGATAERQRVLRPAADAQPDAFDYTAAFKRDHPHE